MTRRLTLSLAALCALAPNDGPLYPVKSGEPFRGGLAQVYTRGGLGYIDREGNFVWKPTRL